MFALIVREISYPCGNVVGVFNTMQLATKALQKLEGDNTEKEVSFEIVEIKVNHIYRCGFNGCLGCCTELIVQPHTAADQVDSVATKLKDGLHI